MAPRIDGESTLRIPLFSLDFVRFPICFSLETPRLCFESQTDSDLRAMIVGGRRGSSDDRKRKTDSNRSNSEEKSAGRCEFPIYFSFVSSAFRISFLLEFLFRF